MNLSNGDNIFFSVEETEAGNVCLLKGYHHLNSESYQTI